MADLHNTHVLNYVPPKKRFLCDVDEVLVDFQGEVLDVLERVCGRRLRPQDFNGWDMFVHFQGDEEAKVREIIQQPGFCRNLKPLPGAVEGLRRLRELVDIFAVTAPFKSSTWAFERVISLEEHFGIDKKHVVQTNSKFLIKGDYLLDDCPKYLGEWKAEHPDGIALLQHLPNTQGLTLDFPHTRVFSWEDVLRHVQETYR
jgi:5'(3')-deoxyribonucleotidase